MNTAEKPVVSIIVPVYHAGERLPLCIKSILSQTEKSFELILVNDGSDEADEICLKKATENDPRIVLIEQENRGISAARNNGISVSKGKYISFVDADDEISPNMIEALLSAIKQSNKKIAVCGVQVCESKTLSGELADGCFSAEEYLRKMLEDDGWKYVIACNKLYSAELFKNNRFPEGKIHEDEFLIPQLIVEADGAVCLSEKNYIYFVHEGSTSQTMSAKRLDYIEALTGQLELAKKEKMSSLFEGIIKREMFAYLVMLSADEFKEKNNRKKLLEIQKKFNASARKCKISLPLRLKRIAAQLIPKTYLKLDTALQKK